MDSSTKESHEPAAMLRPPASAAAAAAAGMNSSEREVVLTEVPVTVQRIYIDSLLRTKDDIVVQHVKQLFSAQNFEEMVKVAHTAKQQMENLGLFKSVGIHIDISRGEKAKKDGYDVTYIVKEPRRVTGGLSTLVGTNEGSLLLSLRLPNVAGRGERISSDFTYGSKNALGWSVNFNKPLLGNPRLNFQMGIFQNSVEFPWSCYKELDRGVACDFMFPGRHGTHILRWEGVWRELSCLSRATAFSVREQAGPSLKSVIRHTWAKDTRDSRVLPNTGYLIKAVQELAGLGGDINYWKQETELQANKKLAWDSVIQLSVAAGVMNTFLPGTRLNIMDQFFLGGPLTLRGFNIKGVGPHEDGCALGANAYWCTGLHLYTPLPFRPGKGGFGDYFRTHFFVNAGNLSTVDFGRQWRENLTSLTSTARWSYGAGIVLRMGGIARLELNYCVPVRSQPGDSVNHGLQFGIGVTFL
jgi:outer membrane protein insertion porin family